MDMTTATVPPPFRFGWSLLAQSLKRPYPVTLPMVLLMALVPGYIFIAAEVRTWGTASAPAIALDRMIPLQPAWALVYGVVYLFLILLPLFVVREPGHVRRTLHAYLAVWITAYAVFLLYPTSAPRPEDVPAGGGFTGWGIRALYGSDPPFNCFPSLHVAHSFVSALAVLRIHRGLGRFAIVCAALVGVSTLFTRQHYVLDVVAGALMAWAACAVFLRRARAEDVPPLDRDLAPFLAVVTAGIVSCFAGAYWIVYLLGVEF